MKKIITGTLLTFASVGFAMAQGVGNYPGLVLNELNGNDKFIELYNGGDEALKLKGVYMEKDGKNVWTAGDITLDPKEFLLLYSEDVIVDHPEYEGAGLVFKSGLSPKKAVRVQLFTPTGLSLDDFNLKDYSTPAPASYSRNPDGTGEWVYADATPGEANAEPSDKGKVEGLADPVIDEDPEDTTPVDYSGLALNELNGNDKFIELYNYGSEAIPLRGVYMYKDENNVWRGGDLTIEAGAYLLLYSEDTLAEQPDNNIPGKVFSSGLSAKKAVMVALMSPAGETIDCFNLVELVDTAAASYSRCPDGTGPWMHAEATPGSANALSDVPVLGLEGQDQEDGDNTGDGDENKDDETEKPSDGLTEIYDSQSNDDIYYDLQGRRVANPTKGIYIVNGKKILVK